MSGQCHPVKRVNMEPHVSGIQCGYKPTTNIQKRKHRIPESRTHIYSSVSTCWMTTWLCYSYEIFAMAYRPEFCASAVKDLGYHVMYAKTLKRFDNVTLNMHEAHLWGIYPSTSQRKTAGVDTSSWIWRKNKIAHQRKLYMTWTIETFLITFQHLKLYTPCKIERPSNSWSY